MERARGALVAALAAMLVAVGCAVPGFLPSAGSPRARSVILISGDGMGPAHIEAARRDRSGLELDRLTERGRMVSGPPADGDEHRSQRGHQRPSCSFHRCPVRPLPGASLGAVAEGSLRPRRDQTDG